MGHSHPSSFLVFILFVFHIASICFASTLFDRVSDQHPPENQGFVCKQSRQERSVTAKDIETSTLKKTLYKKWQVGRVSRKHYEIINMLWRRTKAFLDLENTTISNPLLSSHSQQQEANYGHASNFKTRGIQQSSTPSYIEFYYFDEKDDPIKLKNSSMDRTFLSHRRSRFVEKGKPQKQPLISFRMDGPIATRAPISTRAIHYYNPFKLNPNNFVKNPQSKTHEFLLDVLMESRNSTRFGYVLKPLRLVDLFNNNTWFGKKLVTVKVFLNGSRVMQKKQTLKHLEMETSTRTVVQSSEPSLSTIPITPDTKSTTANDRIKFFEMYDRNTMAPLLRKTKQYIITNDEHEKSMQPKDKKVYLENVNQNIGHYNNKNKLRYEKKHVTDTPPTTAKQNLSRFSGARRTKNVSRIPVQRAYPISIGNGSKLASWSNYPFVAVYVYKPTKTHCDAAGISPHWLLAAASCLVRHKLVHSVDARSAYVTYCGVSWRYPERIAYVKYSLVHPKFHPRDKFRRLNYNIGLIQVSTSMESACPNWAPISLMSHQFASHHEGSIVSAVGWGLDRYGTLYTENLPHSPLMVYDGFVYSDTCPGSIAYSKAKRKEDGSGANNVYCLLLPSYNGEEEDPVHGGLLLDGGKLIALYLQEERRRWGAQSAQYTGVWRLIPWLMDVAREPENIETMFPDL